MILFTQIVANIQLQSLVANISTNDTCDEAYTKFTAHYNKIVSSESLNIFCKHFNYVQLNGGKIYEHSDIEHVVQHINPLINKQKTATLTGNCAEDACTIDDPLTPLNPYQTVSFSDSLSSIPQIYSIQLYVYKYSHISTLFHLPLVRACS
ncbi:Hypothetical_protein [Hexamita inflata]|uniref:Hypothetical_protein n=1 Tax=Hexamita inflata TaxID=28002 RepID=A0ABP1I8P5_9EUKA